MPVCRTWHQSQQACCSCADQTKARPCVSLASCHRHGIWSWSTVRHAGVEHLLRDVKDATVGPLATEVSRMNAGLQGLQSRLRQVQNSGRDPPGLRLASFFLLLVCVCATTICQVEDCTVSVSSATALLPIYCRCSSTCAWWWRASCPSTTTSSTSCRCLDACFAVQYHELSSGVTADRDVLESLSGVKLSSRPCTYRKVMTC